MGSYGMRRARQAAWLVPVVTRMVGLIKKECGAERQTCIATHTPALRGGSRSTFPTVEGPRRGGFLRYEAVTRPHCIPPDEAAWLVPLVTWLVAGFPLGGGGEMRQCDEMNQVRVVTWSTSERCLC